MKKALSFTMMFGILASFATPSFANVGQIKEYKKAFPDAKPKCIQCHAVEKPKKEDGQHDLNAYGKKVKDAAKAQPPTDAAYKAVGPAPASA
jgi:hypothetical protein